MTTPTTPLTVTPLERVFQFRGQMLPDPNPALSPAEVAKLYALTYPALTTATVLAPKVVDAAQVIEFVEHFGTKG